MNSPVGQRALDGVLQALGAWQLILLDVRVPGKGRRVVLAGDIYIYIYILYISHGLQLTPQEQSAERETVPAPKR